jgi:hypothetical protein
MVQYVIVTHMRKLLLLFTLSLGMAVLADAYAQVRTVPANAKRARVGAQYPLPFVELGGKQVKLAPGAVIYDTDNRTVIHAALPQGAEVAFTTDMQGDVARIYLLTPAEQTQLDQRRR